MDLGKEQRAKSKEQRAKGKEQRAKRIAPGAKGIALKSNSLHFNQDPMLYALSPQESASGGFIRTKRKRTISGWKLIERKDD